MKCRNCASLLELILIDLGMAPPSNAFIDLDSLDAPETHYPLRVLVCEACWLAQTQDFTRREQLFDTRYAYFSSFSTTWLTHAAEYTKAMIARLGLNRHSHVVEVAANDGYLLQYFRRSGIPCLGIEPTASTAEAARSKGIEIIEQFFGQTLGRELQSDGRGADLAVANNVLAHVPDILDFVHGFRELLTPAGVATFEFPHLLQLIEGMQFDTIYHEHYSYLSLHSCVSIFERVGLHIFDAEELPTHGGSLRLYAQRRETGANSTSEAIEELLAREVNAGLGSADAYRGFQVRADAIKDSLLRFLLDAKRRGKLVAAYGAAAKGNTLLNYAGVRQDLIRFVVDKNPAKIGRFLPGSRIPILSEAELHSQRPDYVLILPWNIRAEITAQLSYIRSWGAHFVTAIPALEIL